MARVIVIGGGYGGITVAKGLDPVADVVLIERNDRFIHHAAVLRAAVDDVWEQAIFMPYSYLLNNGEVIQGNVSRVDGNKVYMYGREPIEGDYIILATGSTYPFPAKHITANSAVAKHRLRELRAGLQDAQKALIVGAGTVGLELAGELRAAFPELEIEIVEAQHDMLSAPGYTPEFREAVREQLDALNINIQPGQKLAFLPPTPAGTLGRFEVETTAGEHIDADVWFQCYGSMPVSGYLHGTELEDALNTDGTVRVLPTLQVAGHDHTYALGDITDVPEAKRADAARAQARIVVANIASQIEGGEPVVTYEPKRDWIVLPLGPNHGASQLFDSEGNTRVAGATETAEIKGTDLMVSVIRSQLGLP